MTYYQLDQLAEPPTAPRSRELWLQHAAGFILFAAVREYALSRIDQKASPDCRNAAAIAVDDTLYGLMMLVDGVTGGLRNSTHEVDLRLIVRLSEKAERGDVTLQEMDLRNGDGVCMGFHFWKDGDFGKDPVVVPDLRMG